MSLLVAVAPSSRPARSSWSAGSSTSPPRRPTSANSSPGIPDSCPRCSRRTAPGSATSTRTSCARRGAAPIPRMLKPRHRRDRGPPLLAARRHRPPGHPARRRCKDVFGGGRDIQGGSTLTMQLVRNMYLARPARRQPVTEAQDHRGQARRGARAQAQPNMDPRPSTSTTSRYGTVGRPDGDRRRRRLGDVLQQARLAADAGPGGAARRTAPGAVGVQPVPGPGARSGTPPSRCSRRWSQSDYITADAGRRADQALASGPGATTTYTQGRRAVRVRLRAPGADPALRARHRREGRPEGVHDDRPQAPASRRGRRSSPTRAGQADPAAALVSIDPSNGHILAMATSSNYDQTTSTTPRSRTGRRGRRSRCSC